MEMAGENDCLPDLIRDYRKHCFYILYSAGGQDWVAGTCRGIDPGKLEQMVKNRSLSLQLNEDEINALAIQGMQKTEPYRSYMKLWKLDGMRIHLQPGGLEAQVQMEPFPGIRAEANILYDMEWNPEQQSVRAVPQSVRMMGWEIPESWLNLKPMEFPIAAELPDWVKVKEFDFNADGWAMKLGLSLTR